MDVQTGLLDNDATTQNIVLLSNSASNLERAAAYSELRYNDPSDSSSLVFNNTKKLTLQSLASVAYNISNIANSFWDSLSLEEDNIKAREASFRNLCMFMAIDREKTARREIGRLAVERQSLKENTDKIRSQQLPEKASRYLRLPIDYSVLDDLGHGVQTNETEPRNAGVNRAHSVVSGDLNASNIGLYERWVPTQVGHGMYSQDTLRPSKNPYGVPHIQPNYYNSYVTLRRNPSHLNGNNQYGQHGSGQYGQYGSSQYGGSMLYATGGNQRGGEGGIGYSEAPQQYMDDPVDPLPPPPSAKMMSGQHQSLIPPNYLYKARVIYDYDAVKADELNLRTDSIVYVVRRNEDGWHEGVLDGATGLFPENYVEIVIQ